MPIIMMLLDGGSNTPSSEEIESSMREKLNTVITQNDFTLITEAQNGHQFVYNLGASSVNKTYQSASTSKWVTGALILWFVQRGSLNLDSNPQDFLDYWPTSGPLADITIENLLSFTSGLNTDPLCINLANVDFLECVERIPAQNQSINTPGTEFFYGPSHMQVAGAMLIQALGLNNWSEVFTEFKSETGLFENSNYSLPSISNPRLAGGMEWTASDYMEFLAALYHGNLLNQVYRDQLFKDQLVNADIVYSPSLEGLNEDWHYGQGVWLECRPVMFNCQAPFRVSSPGAFGAYPFIDFKNSYFGIVARQGEPATAYEGVSLLREVEIELEQWSFLNK